MAAHLDDASYLSVVQMCLSQASDRGKDDQGASHEQCRHLAGPERYPGRLPFVNSSNRSQLSE